MFDYASALAFAKDFEVTKFLSAAVVGFGAAYFGAKTAQGTADRNRFRDDLIEEIRDTNAALTLAFAVSNSAMQIKRQHLRDLKINFDQEKKGVLEFFRKREAGEIPRDTTCQLQLDMRFLAVPNMATETLQAHVLDRLSVVGRALNLVMSIVESDTALRTSTTNRNEQIKTFRADPSPRDVDFVARLLGFRTANGELDEVFATTLDAMVLHLDCVIYFTYLLCADLKDHGDWLVVKYKKRLGKNNAPEVTEVDFSQAKADKLIPPREEFETWHTAFVKRPKALTWRTRLLQKTGLKKWL